MKKLNSGGQKMNQVKQKLGNNIGFKIERLRKSLPAHLRKEFEVLDQKFKQKWE